MAYPALNLSGIQITTEETIWNPFTHCTGMARSALSVTKSKKRSNSGDRVMSIEEMEGTRIADSP